MSTPIVCHFLIGIPGSGKSTFAAKLAKVGSYHIVSTDTIRQQLYGDATIQGEWSDIEATVISQITQAIAQGNAVIYDATNTKRASRLDLLLKLDAKLTSSVLWMGWYLQTPLATCKTWNQKRTPQVPEAVIDKMYQSLQKFPPVAAEGFVSVKVIDITNPKLNFQEVTTQGQKLPRCLTNRANRNSHVIYHAYSKLLDFERLMHLLSVIIRYPGVGNLQTSDPQLLENILGGVPNFTSSLGEVTACVGKLCGEVYANEQAIARDLLWLEENSLIGVNTLSSSSHLPISPSPTPLMISSTHPYSDLPAFARLLQTIRFILHYPFLPKSPQGSLNTLVSTLQGYGIIQGSTVDSLRKDIEKVLKPYKILPQFPMRDGYFAGTAILSTSELSRVFQILQSQAKSLDDPTALEIYETFTARMEASKLGANQTYPVRAIANRNMIDLEYLPTESLARNLPQVEEFIIKGQLIELNRFPGSGRFSQDEEGFFLAYPLQIVFHNFAWYLGYEYVGGKSGGLFRVERLDRLFFGRSQTRLRSPQEQRQSLEKLQKLADAGIGIYLGRIVSEQHQFLSGNKQERSQVCITIELWFKETIFRFVAEGTKRFPTQQMRMSPLKGKFNLPKSIFALEPTGDRTFPHRFQVVLPKWSLDDVDLWRWIVGFGGGVKVIRPPELVDKLRTMGREIVEVYESHGE